MRTINVSGDYRVKSDKYCWILEIRSDGKTSKGEHKDVWTPRYYPTFEKIANKIVQEEAKLADSLEGVLESMDKAAKRIGQNLREQAL